MPRSKLLDRGEEIMTVYPEVFYTDSSGNRLRAVGREGKTIRVTITQTRTSASDVIGQVSIEKVKGTTRTFAGWDWSRVIFRGQEWDVVTPPKLASGASKAGRHFHFEISSRNKLDNHLAPHPTGEGAADG